MAKALITILAAALLAGCVTTDTISGWSFRKDTLSKTGYAFAVVRKEDGHPVRSGEKSLRFEVRHGDCMAQPWWSDCATDRERNERAELSPHHVGEYWYAWSLYLPEDFPSIHPVLVTLGQFHLRDHRKPAFLFQIVGSYGGGYYKPQSPWGLYVLGKDPIAVRSMRGRWTDVLVHAKWTKGDDGWLRMYVNGRKEPTYSYSGVTSPRVPHGGVYFKFGLYRAFVSRRFIANPKAEDTPTQVVYYDDVRKGRTCQEVTEYFDCAAIAMSE